MNNNTKIAIGVGIALIFGYAVGSSGNEQTVQETPTETYEEAVEKYENEVVEQVKAEPKKATKDDMFIQGDDFSMKITSIETSGSNLVVNYDYNNESDGEQTPITTVSIRCYQNGVELDTSFARDNYKDQDTILGGYSNEGLQDMVKLSNKEDTILIRIDPWVSFTDEIFAEFEFNPVTNEVARIK